MWGKANKWHKLLVLGLVLVLLVPGLVACDDDEEDVTVTVTETVTETYTGQPTSQTTTSATATHPEEEPVKIGALTSWSGPTGLIGLLADQVLSVVEDQVRDMGGILNGRPVEFTKYDDEGQVSRIGAGFNKLVLDDDVAAVVFGGASSATGTASSDAAEEHQVPYITFIPEPTDLSDRPYTSRANFNIPTVSAKITSFVLEHFNPSKVAILASEAESIHMYMRDYYKPPLKSAGVEIVYEEYVPMDMTDFAPYLTNIKYAKPDVVIAYLSPVAQNMAMLKEITALGGWEDIEFISSSPASSGGTLELPGAQGTYHWALWAPGLPYPGSQEFERAFMQTHGKLPLTEHSMIYICAWTAIHAIELAGTTDHEETAEAVRSGNLHWDSPAGELTVGTDGETNLTGTIFVCEGGKLIPVTE